MLTRFFTCRFLQCFPPWLPWRSSPAPPTSCGFPADRGCSGASVLLAAMPFIPFQRLRSVTANKLASSRHDHRDQIALAAVEAAPAEQQVHVEVQGMSDRQGLRLCSFRVLATLPRSSCSLRRNNERLLPRILGFVYHAVVFGAETQAQP